ncbi:MAG: Asp23/Gls24 family envelope stress response protein [Synergistaceae bacterium]|nr:Asp23/Gls24 family envelope stress response protein [Synergistaceae bacterium]
MTENEIIFDSIETFVFSGAAGTGKSRRAQYVASLLGADYIIDDGLVIHKGSIVCGKSAKSELNRISAIRRAIFDFEGHRNEVIEFFKEVSPCNLLVIATSDSMADKILKKLGMKAPSRTIHIEDVSTKEDMEKARIERYGKKQHVIPVSQALVRKNFSGKLVGQLRGIWGVNEEKETEKTIVHPPFSFCGEMHVEPEAIKQLTHFLALRTEQTAAVKELSISSYDDGVEIDVEISALAGSKTLLEVAENVKKRIMSGVGYFTGIDIKKINVTVAEVLL